MKYQHQGFTPLVIILLVVLGIGVVGGGYVVYQDKQQQKKLEIQISKLGYISEKLQKKHDHIFQKIVQAQRSNNHSYAKAYAIELQEIRKMNKTPKTVRPISLYELLFRWASGKISLAPM